jgi:hypothetical protein
MYFIRLSFLLISGFCAALIARAQDYNIKDFGAVSDTAKLGLGNRARKHRADAPEPPFGQMRNITISNITATHTGNYASSITDVPGAAIENITLNNIRIAHKGGLKPGSFLADAAHVKEDEKGYPEPTVWKNLPAAVFFLRHVQQANFQHCSFESELEDPRQAIVTADVDKLDLHQVTYNNKPL